MTLALGWSPRWLPARRLATAPLVALVSFSICRSDNRAEAADAVDRQRSDAIG
jgi:hypothetical protein